MDAKAASLTEGASSDASPSLASTHKEDHVVRDVKLIPEPSSSPHDPLNWTEGRKLRLLLVVSFAAYSMITAASAGQLAYPIQAPIYHKSVTDLSYTVSAQIAGLALSPLFLMPFTHIIGRPSMLVLTMLLGLGTAVWSAEMTHADDYAPFLASRVIAGLSASIAGIVGSSMIMDIYFLHQRGRAFLIYTTFIAFGTVSSTTFSGYIVSKQSWTVSFWWTVPLVFIALVLVLLVVEETAFDRTTPRDELEHEQVSRTARVLAFLPITTGKPKVSRTEIVRRTLAPFAIALSPTGLLTGLFLMIFFGWVTLLDISGPVFLQLPRKAGGYGLNTEENANVSFASWIALAFTQLLGYFMNDRIPLWICKRMKGGIWTPELRLYCLFPSFVLMPVGLGIIGASLGKHYNIVVFGVGWVLAVFSGLIAVPIANNYVSECFTGYAAEVTIVNNIFRFGWGVAIPFFLLDWEAKVGITWLFGMAAFFSIASAFIVFALIWKGETLRRYAVSKSLLSDEAGKKAVVEAK